MRLAAFDRSASKRSANLSLNRDLIAKARADGLNLSALMVTVVAAALAQKAAERLKAEIARSCEAYDRILAEYGSLAEAVWAETGGDE